MEYVDELVRQKVLDSLASSIGKLEKALVSVHEKRCSTTVVSRRLQALQIGYAALKAVWSKEVFSYTPEEAVGAKAVLASLFPLLEAQVPRFAPGSSQATLLSWRIRSIQLALQALE